MTSGKTYGTFITKFPPNHYQYKKETIRQVSRNGINFSLDISDIMAWYIYFDFKEPAKEKLYSLIKNSNTVIDIGANIGETSLNFAKLVGDKGKIYSFEPDPINYKSLEYNLSLNNFKNISLNNLGLGNQAGTFKIHTYDNNNKGMNRIVSNNSEVENYREISVTTLNDYVKKQSINKIDVIKIDVEGFELNVLKGAKDVLKQFSPDLFIELDESNLIEQGSSAIELIALLSEFNYNIVNADNNNLVTINDNFDSCHYDIIATKNSSKNV
ncbi:MAG: FkbM family methyltransferase [Vicingaceae bacterium]|nr:FkbM family methyltransferase [Vicingaceae bacterium]